MNIPQSAAALVLGLVVAFPLHADMNPRSPVAGVPAADAARCAWQAELAPDWVRSPVQMDIHAAYRLFVFQSDGTIGYRVRSAFPHAAFLSYTIYDGPLAYAALLDHAIEPDPGSVNPFLPGEFVQAANRSYTVTVLPEGAVLQDSMPNPIFTPLPRRHSDLVTVVLAQRIYLPEPGLDRFGGFEAPVIEAFELSDPATPAACPSGDFSAITSQFGSSGPRFSQAPLPRNGRIEFYRPPAMMVPYADASGLLTRHDCTGYLMATVHPDRLAVVHLPTVPLFFDNTAVTPSTTFVAPYPEGVRYLSLGSYGASPLGEVENENIAGPEMKTLLTGGAAFVAIPIGMSHAEKQAVERKAGELGYNVMPLARYGSLIPGDEDGLRINPFLIYRNKVATTGFAGDIQNVPCFRGRSFDNAPWVYAASPANMGEYAPIGVECTVADFLDGYCGQYYSYPHR